MQAKEVEAMAVRLTMQGYFQKAADLIEAAAAAKRKAEQKERIKNIESTLSTISTLQTAKSKELAAIGKAAAISTATIDTFVGVGKAWSLGPILGPPMAALVAAAGLANVAKIAGTPLAQGGIVLPRQGGTLATIGEAGKAEAVIPLDDPRTQDRLGGVLGGDVHIHIEAGTLIADDYSVEQFAQKIDEKLFMLKRNRRAVS